MDLLRHALTLDRFDRHAELDAVLADNVADAVDALRAAIDLGDLHAVRGHADELAAAARGLRDLAHEA